MLSEACATGKPVRMFDLAADAEPPSGETAAQRLGRLLARCILGRLQALLYRELF